MDKLNQLKHLANQLIVEGNLGIIDNGFTSSYLAHAGEKSHHGHKFLHQYTKQLRKAIPDIKLIHVEILNQNNDVITWQRILSGTHKANLKGIPASNKRIKWYEIVVSRFENEKIAEEWLASDLAFQLMLKQQIR